MFLNVKIVLAFIKLSYSWSIYWVEWY